MIWVGHSYIPSEGHSSGDRSQTLSTTSNLPYTRPQSYISQHTTQAILHPCPHIIPQLDRATPAPTSSSVALILEPPDHVAVLSRRTKRAPCFLGDSLNTTLPALSWAPSQCVWSHAHQKIMGNPHYHHRPVASVRHTIMPFASLPLTRTGHSHPSYLGYPIGSLPTILRWPWHLTSTPQYITSIFCCYSSLPYLQSGCQGPRFWACQCQKLRGNLLGALVWFFETYYTWVLRFFLG